MTVFLILAALLTVAGVLAVALPLLRRGAAESAPPAPWMALGSALFVIVGSALLYAHLSNWSWRPAAAADSPQTMVARLARELEANPQNLDGWLMLGRSYVVLQELPLALRAFERADRLSEGKNVEAVLGEAEVLALEDPTELDGRAGRLIDRALQLAPDSGKALFFGATVAARRGDFPLARERFARLLAMNPPDNVRPILEQEIRALDERMAAPAGAAAQPGASGTAPAIHLTVTLAPGVAAGTGAPLFVFVRAPGGPGPPLAAKRLESHFPQSVTLTPADAMIRGGRSFAAGQAVQVVARIARSGTPTGASGDPYGEITYQVGQDAPASLVINRVTP